MVLRLQPIPFSTDQFLSGFEEPIVQEILKTTDHYFKKVGYIPPWIGYLVWKDQQLVGTAAFKGPPLENKVEIAYGIFDQFQNQGLGTLTAKNLTEIALSTDPSVCISARTLPEENFSTKILTKIGFSFSGNIIDPEDGEVWEWIYQPT